MKQGTSRAVCVTHIPAPLSPSGTHLLTHLPTSHLLSVFLVPGFLWALRPPRSTGLGSTLKFSKHVCVMPGTHWALRKHLWMRVEGIEACDCWHCHVLSSSSLGILWSSATTMWCSALKSQSQGLPRGSCRLSECPRPVRDALTYSSSREEKRHPCGYSAL